MKSSTPLELSITATSGKSLVRFLRKNLLLAHTTLASKGKSELSELSVALVGDKTMSALHQQFMEIAGPTDVLTFPLDTNSRGSVVAGEIVVCVPEARRQSSARGVELRLEVLLYALHGMLHLAGFDDRTSRDFATMHRTEDSILKTLGFGPIFYHRVPRQGR